MRVIACLCLCLCLPACLESRPPTYQEISAKLVGKSKAEVRSVMGRPDNAVTYGDETRWTYFDVWAHPDSPGRRNLIWVVFDRRGKVIRVDR